MVPSSKPRPCHRIGRPYARLVSRSRQGFLFGIAAYLLWGGFPLYWPLLEPAGSVELLAHRILWSVVTLGVLVLVLRRSRQFRALFGDRRVFLLLALAAAVITVNWGTYIYGVTNDRVVETSLGYFINPLVTVLMGVVLLGERLQPAPVAGDRRRRRWPASCSPSTTATRPGSRWCSRSPSAPTGWPRSRPAPRRSRASPSRPCSSHRSPSATSRGSSRTARSTFGTEGTGHALLLMSAGLVTAVPLLCFGAAAIRVPMVTLGLLQYLAPILQFLLGVLWFHEAMSTGRWIGFALVWVALAIFTVESVRHRRRQLRLAAEAVAV